MAHSTLGLQIPAPDDLHSGNIMTQPVSVAAGTYVRGEVLGLTGNVYGKLIAAAAAGGIVTEDITIAGETVLPIYVGGDFNEDAVDLNGQALADTKTALRTMGLFLRKWGAAPDSA